MRSKRSIECGACDGSGKSENQETCQKCKGRGYSKFAEVRYLLRKRKVHRNAPPTWKPLKPTPKSRARQLDPNCRTLGDPTPPPLSEPTTSNPSSDPAPGPEQVSEP